MQVYQALLESELPDQDAAHNYLKQYFPEQIRARYGKYIKEHPLKREIVATMITNKVVDLAGCAFCNALVRQTGTSIVRGITAYLVFDEVIGGDEIREQIMAADNRMSTGRQYNLLIALEKALAGLCRQVIEQDLPLRFDSRCVNNYRQRLSIFKTHLQELLPADEWQVCVDVAEGLAQEGFPATMAIDMASFRYLAGFVPAVHIAEATGADLLVVTTAMGDMRLRLKISQVMESLKEFTSHDRWDRLALASLRSSFIKQAVGLTRNVVAAGEDAGSFLGRKKQRLDYYLDLLDALRTSPPTTTSPYMVLLRALEALAD